MNKKRKPGWKMSKNINQKQVEQREKNIKAVRLWPLSELDELHAEEKDILLALKKCSRKMWKSEKEKEKEEVFQ